MLQESSSDALGSTDTGHGTTPTSPAPPPRFIFNEQADRRSEAPESGLTFAVRTDASFATDSLQRHITQYLADHPEHPWHNDPVAVRAALNSAYQEWGHNVLTAKARYLDYSQYGLAEPKDRALDVHFYNARALTHKAIGQALDLVMARPDVDEDTPVFFISLDDMITKQSNHWADIGFSRLFDLSGRNQSGYRGRPGMKPLKKQIEDAKESLRALHEQYGRPVPIVLLEDNVRHAKMLNWVIDALDQNGVFDHGSLAAIASCFCCATPEERQKIRHRGETIPLGVVIDYEQQCVDVCTPRDLFFDGFVVEIEGRKTRLSGLFMDVAARFKIRPDFINAFQCDVAEANVVFCEQIERALGRSLPVAWFNGADAIAHVTRDPLDRPMRDIMQRMAMNARAALTVSHLDSPSQQSAATASAAC